MVAVDFKKYPKIMRVEARRPNFFTEKLDGTNACVVIGANGEFQCQKRTEFIYPTETDDNFGFAAWAFENKEELLKLGVGHHYGEWWGKDIRRDGYGLEERRFSLFDAKRWGAHNPNTPKCCHVVPILPVNDIEEAKAFLKTNGSMAAPGFMDPEGAIMFDYDVKRHFKIIISEGVKDGLENDE